MAERKPPVFLIDSILPSASLAVMFSAPNVGKSFVALDMAFCLAAGIPWHGHKTQQTPVVYIVGEGLAGMGNRVRAWRLNNDVPQGVAVGVQLRFWDREVQFASVVAQMQFRDAMIEAAHALGGPPKLIIIDTMAACNAGKDENSVEDMTAFIEGVKAVRPTDATILILHHEGRVRGRERGSTALPGAVDTKMYLQQQMGQPEGVLVLSCQKQRDAEKFDPIGLRLRVVTLPNGEDSCVVEEHVDQTPTLPKEWTAAVNVLKAYPDGSTNAEWMTACDLPRRTFYRMKKEVLERKLVIERADGKYVLPIEEPPSEPPTEENNGAS